MGRIFSLPSVQHYLVADPDKPLLIHHARGQGDVLQTRILNEASTALILAPPGLTVDVSDMFTD